MKRSACFRIYLFSGLVTQCPADFYNFLLEVQNKLAKVIKSVGKVDHTLYPFLIHNMGIHPRNHP